MSTLKFSPPRDPDAVTKGVASPTNLAELGTYLYIAVVVLIMRRSRCGAANARTTSYPYWAVVLLVSATWSIIPLFSFVRASQVLIVIALAYETGALAHRSVDAWHQVVRTTLRLVVGVGCGLTVLAFATGAFADGDGRIYWYGVHPFNTAAALGALVLILLPSTPDLLGIPRFLRIGAISLLTWALVGTPTRTALAALLLAVLAWFWVLGRDRRRVRHFGLFYLVSLLGIGAVVGKDRLMTYLLRDDTSQYVLRASNRLDAWEAALAQLDTWGDWLIGLGLGAPKVVLAAEISWAGEAHNAWIELLVAGGLAALTAAAVALGGLTVQVFRESAQVAPLAAPLLVYLLILSLSNQAFVLPGFLCALGAMVYALALGSPAQRHSKPALISRPAHGTIVASVPRSSLRPNPRRA
jgi:hypothetical protein